MQEHSSGFVVFRLEEGKTLYLLLRNSRDRCWGLPKGKVDPGETDEKAAARELSEESGITYFQLLEGFDRTATYWFTRNGERINKTVRYFLARVDTSDIKISTEHSDYGWFTIEEARERIRFANLFEVILEADKIIGNS